MMHKRRNSFRAIALLTVLFAAGKASPFPQPNLSGLQVMTNVYERPQPHDLQGSLTMTLENARGEQRIRSIRQYIGRFGDVEKKLLFFSSPADVRDTSFMSWSYDNPNRPDDQWIYLPALRRVRRISAEKKNDSFMGSDFEYEDLSRRHPELDVHRVLRTESFNGHMSYVVESIPESNDSKYGRTVTWINEGAWIGLRKEFYDRKGNLVKTLIIDEYSQIDSFWTITKMTMTDVRTGHSTVMELSDLDLNTGIPEQSFSERSMTRGIR